MTMTMTEEVTPGQLHGACLMLGLEPGDVLEIHLYSDRIFVTEIDRNPDGSVVLDGDSFRKKLRTIQVKRGES